MNEALFINIHTHGIKFYRDVFSIINVYPAIFEIDNSFSNKIISLGIHPLFIKSENIEEELSVLRRNLNKKNVLAVGEVGLDRFSKTNLTIQEYCFVEQIKLANKNYKPIIIHCVRCFSELIHIKKKQKTNIAWIIHAFQANEIITKQLIKHDFYFSLGADIIRLTDNNSIKQNMTDREFKLLMTINIIPINRVFLETDEAAVHIKAVYKAFAIIKEIELVKLISIIHSNFKKCFNIDDRYLVE